MNNGFKFPLFSVSVSCFPLSPGHHPPHTSPAFLNNSRDQLNVIMEVCGTLSQEDIDDIGDVDVRTYLQSLAPRPAKSLAAMYPGAEVEAIALLEIMLKKISLKFYEKPPRNTLLLNLVFQNI